MPNDNPQDFALLDFLASTKNSGDRLPPLAELSRMSGISIAILREQLAVARALGLVEVRPKTGIRRLPYSFTPAVLNSLTYAAKIDPEAYFPAFADLRCNVEAAYWRQAVALLTQEDRAALQVLVQQAEEKLAAFPVQIPHREHRALHLLIYQRLGNPFVTGLLEAYWEAYEAIGLNTFTDLHYLQQVWAYHRRMVEAICAGKTNEGYQALIEHTDLIHSRPPQPKHQQSFE